MSKDKKRLHVSFSRALFLDHFFDRRTRPIIIYPTFVIGIGAVLYHWLKGWSWLDSVYFVVITLTTIKKGSFEMQKLGVKGVGAYLAVCGVCLARAHARTGDSAWISGYLGTRTVFDEAIGDYAVAYANQAEHDYQLLVEAVNSGQIQAQTGI